MWTILRSINDWEKYQQNTAQALRITGVPIAWGDGPKEYPCLISTYVPPTESSLPPRMVSAYVYMSDAESLIVATGVKVAIPGKATEVHGDLAKQGAFNRWVSAYLLALVREMREVGALKAQSFEQSLMEALSLVDEVATEKKDQVIQKLPHKEEKNFLDRFFPTE